MQHLPPRWQSWKVRHPQKGANEPPLRAELFSVEQLAQHARFLASGHQVDCRKHANPLLTRLDSNERNLRSFNRITREGNPGQQLTPAAEWLLDNFYLIEEQIQMARRHLPRGYSRELPHLLAGSSAGLPRVYDIVLELISHVDAQIDPGPLEAFIAAYQSVATLRIGELWAVPIMLRLSLIENLQRITTRLTASANDRDLADQWVDRLQEMAETNPSQLIIVVADMARSELPLTSSFVAEFSQRLSQHSPLIHLARTWLEHRLIEQGTSIELLVHQDSQNQAADQVSVSHSISSLRFLSAMDWKEFVESLSAVEATLRGDPAEVYAEMDFPTRDRYRHSVEALSRHGSLSEEEVAQKAVELASDAARMHGAHDRSAHVGFYLIDKGLPDLERAAHVRWPWRAKFERGIQSCPLAFYAGGIGLITVAATAVYVRESLMMDTDQWILILLGLVFFLCASQLGVSLMNWLITLLVKPRLLPRLDFSGGIAVDCRTMVVVPTMLTTAEGAARLIETLEIHYLSNRDSLLHFALLTDFRDAEEEVVAGDDFLLGKVRSGIESLNGKYPSGGRCRFFLFHRPRRWNASEETWMGFERKRGKLTEFNALLRGGAARSFSAIVGETSILPSIRYVITLDTDTQLPREAGRKLVGTMAHLLNRPEFDSTRGVVTEGYGVLQPRIGVSLPGSRRSWFVRLFAGDAGIDPYTRQVSDVYQDMFQEGSFIGKGIYDVDAFQRAMTGRFPENTVLSHDLLEACHARSALVSDVEFFEQHPSRYNVDIDRRHRWIRGDWQITQWLLPRVPGPDARRIANPLSALSLWKIFDNLRRSLIPIALMVFMVGTWILIPAHGGSGVLLVVVLIALPGLLSALANVIGKPQDVPWRMHLRSIGGAGGCQLGQIFLTLAFLPYDAFVSVDAIGKTLHRLLVTRKRLLEWRTSSDAEGSSSSDLAGSCVTMWIAPTTAVVAAIAFGSLYPVGLTAALPILLMWFAAPWIAWWISLPIERSALDISLAQVAFLRRSARKTWRFFETFVTAEEHWLPPDNFQEVPVSRVASRTSPTNMGLALLANLAARDLGYLSGGGVIRRTRDTLETMRGLERYRGHFYNWYDTRTLQPLMPLYVSSVDSGNLAGHLLTLGAGLREQADVEFITPHLFTGLSDTVAILIDLCHGNAELVTLAECLKDAPTDPRGAFRLMTKVNSLANLLAREMVVMGEHANGWANCFKNDCEEHLAEMVLLAPWLALSGTPPDWLEAEINQSISLRDLAGLDELVCPQIDGQIVDLDADQEWPAFEAHAHLSAISGCVRDASATARERLLTLEALALQSDELAAMDFAFLFDPARDLFSIGFNVPEQRCDIGFYDLLASEARLCSYVAIALGQIPQDHWFSMGRLLVASGGEPLLVSWSGSMFEYLMPLLVMPNYERTLLDHTCRAAVQQQIDYGKSRDIPWGISESGYNRTDVALNYQYHAFGVPGLGLKRGLSDDLVIAPYASAMALLVAPRDACENLQRLENDGRSGTYGFYEAVDYTASRLPPEKSSVTIRSYMAHHQGMSLLAFANLLHDYPMHRRFMACPMLKAAELLLQERVPKTASSVFADDTAQDSSRTHADDGESVMRVFTNPTPPTPDVHLLSNGRYHVAISSAGGGYSRWRDLAVTRWREDATRDCWGSFIYLRDLVTGDTWSSAYQPTLQPTTSYEAIFTQSRAEFRHGYAGLGIHTEISVSPEDDVELRRITISNRSSVARTIELTSYAEVVLAPPNADEAHPAFSNLFVQTEFIPESSAILCSRRSRNEGDTPPWLLHLMTSQRGFRGETTCETDRSRFIGRGGSTVRPAAMQGDAPLSNTVGPVLDPIVSLRCSIVVPAHGSAVVNMVLGVADDRDSALALVEKYQSHHMAERAFDLAWTHNQVTLHHLNTTESETQLYGRLAGSLIYSNPARRANSGVLLGNRRGSNGLWSYGISGDTPIVILRISDVEKIELVRQLIRAHSYWRMKGLTVDLVILHEDVSIYRQSLGSMITDLISSGLEAQMMEKPGGIFVRSLDQIPHQDRLLLLASARVVLDDEKGTLAEQLEHRGVFEPMPIDLTPTRAWAKDVISPSAHRELKFQNGYGGFTRDGHEYVITLKAGEVTPAPWVNVLANPEFGTVISESGASYTWAENAHEFRLTPWSNDPVQDPPGEAIYIRDEQTGRYWSPTPSPARGATPYVIRHGFGYTVFEHVEDGIQSELWVYVSMAAPVKFMVLKLRNLSGRPRRLSVTAYCEWVLGEMRHKSLLHVQTELDPKTGALFARNHSNAEFHGRTAFLDVNDPSRTLTGDRKEFIGRNGNLTTPAAMKRTRLAGRVGAGLDPCGAVQVIFDLEDKQERETSFRLGVGHNVKEARDLIDRFRKPDACRIALEGVWNYWNTTLGAVNVDTPDASVNVMANGWLLYQNLSCRIWARTGFYQSGGAYGFRDQLQDVMAMVHAEPAITREHLLRAAARQFREGDVQHWWHPPVGRGVRTHFSDDYLWLPYVTCHYVTCVADTGVLDEVVPFLDARPVKLDEEAYYDLPIRAEESDTLYQHCVRAIERGLKLGSHGLPLIGCGDWNDGMNRIGKDGRGESVWLAFFLYDVLVKFSDLAVSRGDSVFAERCLEHSRLLQKNIEANSWDGDWYRRAYFDNGQPLGSKVNLECQIDSLPQSWSVLSSAGDPERSRRAMESANQRLIRRADKLVQLFDPPFDESTLNPGYIKSYIPGVRENGGQYTHAAIWMAMAFAKMGDSTRAWELFGMLNPINHGTTKDQIDVYKVEPYVVAADVYAVAPHIGRGGWTWYTGSAGWMYRLLIETLLGVNLEGDQLRMTPCLPAHWPGFKVHYRYRQTVYHINITRVVGDTPEHAAIVVDGHDISGLTIPLRNDQHEHSVEIRIR